jgi:hypothetical protein
VRIIAAIMCAALTGCSTLYAGVADYTVRPFKDPDTGKLVCCEAHIISGKNIGAVAVHFVRNGDQFTVDVTENAIISSASITAANAAVSDVAKAVTETAITVKKLTKDVP